MSLTPGDIAKIDQRRAAVDETLDGVIAVYLQHRHIGCCAPEQELPGLAHNLKIGFEIDSLVDILTVAVDRLAELKREDTR